MYVLSLVKKKITCVGKLLIGGLVKHDVCYLLWALRECLHKLSAKTARPATPAKICHRIKSYNVIMIVLLYNPDINLTAKGLYRTDLCFSAMIHSSRSEY